jgi:hypothetical protein
MSTEAANIGVLWVLHPPNLNSKLNLFCSVIFDCNFNFANQQCLGIELFFGGAHPAAKCDCDEDRPRPPPTDTRPLVDTLTPPKPLWPVLLPPAQIIAKFFVFFD